MKAGFYLNHSFKPQNINLALGALPFKGEMNFSNDANNPLDSGFGYANAALGILSSYSQQSKFVEGSYIYNNREWYIQDNWKVNSRLTLDYGLRFVNQQPQHDQFGHSANFFPEQWSLGNAPLLYARRLPGQASPRVPRRGRRWIRGPGSCSAQALPSTSGSSCPGTGNPTQGLIQQGAAGHLEVRLCMAHRGARAALRRRLRRHRQSAAGRSRGRRHLLRPSAGRLGPEPGLQPAVLARHHPARGTRAGSGRLAGRAGAGVADLRLSIRRRVADVVPVERRSADDPAMGLTRST